MFSLTNIVHDSDDSTDSDDRPYSDDSTTIRVTKQTHKCKTELV